MINSAYYGLFAWALIAGAGASLAVRNRKSAWAWGLVASGFALAPLWKGESLAMALHGALAMPSFTLAQLAAWRLFSGKRLAILNRPALWITVVTALIFYPLALGLGSWDPYGIGYQPRPLLLALLPLAGWLTWRRYHAWLVIIGFDLLAYAGGIFANLWDAVLDPVLALIAVLAIILRRR